MKVIYVTTSIEENDYVSFTQQWNISLNPSNQNFHNKIIRALNIENIVEVFSIRPFSKKNCLLKRLPAEEKVVGNIHYHYLKILRNKYLRSFSLEKQAKKLLPNILNEKVLLITDTINPRCVQLANYIKKKYNVTTIGMCTDSPSNISGTSRAYTMYLLNNTKSFDGYITLTEGLNSLYNSLNKSHITFEGIVEEQITNETVSGDYFFFGGALLPRYGVYQLIEAFKQLKQNNISLLICGHHGDEDKLNSAIGDDVRIKYLGILPVKDALALEQHAIANINPRPFTQDLDRLSIPSKTLEYLASGSLTISVKNTELEKVFKDTAIWINSNSPEDLQSALNKALSMSDTERKNIAENAKKTAISLYSIKKIGELLTDFLSTFIQ